jgi:hypothetical protein
MVKLTDTGLSKLIKLLTTAIELENEMDGYQKALDIIKKQIESLSGSTYETIKRRLKG